VVRVVAHQRRHVEGGREAGLSVVEQVAEALVRLRGGAEAGELAHRPQLRAVHRRVDAAGERIDTWIAEVALVVGLDVVPACTAARSRFPTSSRTARPAVRASRRRSSRRQSSTPPDSVRDSSWLPYANLTCLELLGRRKGADNTSVNPRTESGGVEDWRRELYDATPERQGELFSTMSGIENEPLYTPDNVETDYERDLGYPGVYPFTRGVYPSMYRTKLWTMRQFAGFGTAAETNERFRYCSTRTDRPLDRLRHADADGLRLGPPSISG